MGKHTISAMMLATAIAFYAIFGIIIPDTFYISPEAAAKPVEHATAGVGQVLRAIAPCFALVMGAFAVLRFFNELRK